VLQINNPYDLSVPLYNQQLAENATENIAGDQTEKINVK
jgi:hypothetical protein